MDKLTDTSSVPGKPFNLIFHELKRINSPKNVSNSYILSINYLKICFHEDNYILHRTEQKLKNDGENYFGNGKKMSREILKEF